MKSLFRLSTFAFFYLTIVSILSPSFGKDSIADPKSSNSTNALSVIDSDDLLKQLGSHWTVPAGAKEIKNAYVDIQVEMNPDATVRSATVLSTSESMNNPEMKALADSALKAIKNASPLKLHLDRYEAWKTITIHFDPRHIL